MIQLKKDFATRFTFFTSLSLAVLAISTNSLTLTNQAEAFEVTAVSSAKSEDTERQVDEVAMAAQNQAISKLTTLLKKYTGTRQEPILLSKLGELQQQNASILFRIAHGASHRTKKALDLSRFNKATQQTISTLNLLIAKYPHHEEVPRAYFMRGKSQEEIKNKVSAARDYNFLVNNYKDSEDASSAYMSLAEFAIEANDHAKAVSYLMEVEKRPNDVHFPFALYKLAWAQYNLKNIPKALTFGERHIAHYRERQKEEETGTLTSSDNALLENTLMDMAVFYFEGYEQGLPQYQLKETLPYFKKIENGPAIGKMLSRYAKLLRSHNHDKDLSNWKNELLDTESHRPETLDVVLITYEHELNKRRYEQVIATAQDLITLYKKNPKFEAFPKAQKMVLDTAEGLQAIVIKNKEATEVQSYSKILASVYDAFTKIVEESDPRIPRVHYNLAETLFTINDFANATIHYRWVVDHVGERKLAQEKSIKGLGDVKDSAVKAIASRYEVLRKNQMIPKELTARAIPVETPDAQATPSTIDPAMGEWIAWIDTQAKISTDGIENFAFEAARSLYHHGQVAPALERLKKFAVKYPNSKYAIPSATLMIDTYIASVDWDNTHTLATDFMTVKAWKSSDFSKRLFAVASDAFYKRIEIMSKANDFRAVLKSSDEFLKLYAKSERLADTLALAGHAAMNNAERDRAQVYFTRLLKEAPDNAMNSENFLGALIARANMSEDQYLFKAAVSDYRQYLGRVGTKGTDDIRKKVLVLAYLSADWQELKNTIGDKAVCVESLDSVCEKYKAVLALFGGNNQDDAFELARKTTGEARALWATLALESSAKDLVFRDRLLMVRHITAEWDNVDPLIKFAMLPKISVLLPQAFHLNRLAMNEVAPLRAHEKYITRRVEVIREMENAATKVLKMPWSRIRAEVMNEIAALYIDLGRGLSELKAPKDLNEQEVVAYMDTIRKLVMPFEEKGQDIRAKAFAIASTFSIEEHSFNQIVEPFFAENPSQAKALKPTTKTEDPMPISIALLDKLDPTGDWDDMEKLSSSNKVISDTELRVKSLWWKAVKNKNWQQVAFFMQEASEKAYIKAGPMSVVKAVSLASAGAQGEALAEIAEARKDLEPDARAWTLTTLVQYSLKSCAKDKTKELLQQIQAMEGESKGRSLSSEQSSLLNSAKAYVN